MKLFVLLLLGLTSLSCMSLEKNGEENSIKENLTLLQIEARVKDKAREKAFESLPSSFKEVGSEAYYKSERYKRWQESHLIFDYLFAKDDLEDAYKKVKKAKEKLAKQIKKFEKCEVCKKAVMKTSSKLRVFDRIDEAQRMHIDIIGLSPAYEKAKKEILNQYKAEISKLEGGKNEKRN